MVSEQDIGKQVKAAAGSSLFKGKLVAVTSVFAHVMCKHHTVSKTAYLEHTHVVKDDATE